MTKVEKIKKEIITFRNWGELNRSIFKSLFNSENSARDVGNDELKNFLESAKGKIITIKDDSVLNFGIDIFQNGPLEGRYDRSSWLSEEILDELELIFEGKVTFININKIKNITFLGELILLNYNYINFDNCIFENDLSIDSFNQYGPLFFMNCKLKNLSLQNFTTDGIVLYETKFSKLEIIDITLKKSTQNLLGDKLPCIIDIISTSVTGEIIINGIKDLEILHIGDAKVKCNFGNIEIKNITFSSIDSNNYKIDNSEIQKLTLTNSINLSKKLILQDLIINNIEFINSNLGETIFNGVEIKNFYINNANLNDCIFNGVEFPKNYKLIEIKGEGKYKKMKDNYRQLKFVMDKNGNYTEANKFYGLEMEYYMKIKGTSFYEKFILFTSYIFNNFGNSWILPLFWLLSLAYFSTFIYSNISGIYVLETFIKQFLYLLYPLYGIDGKVISDLEIEILLGFTFYKILYITIGWHLIVALKRTTKR